MPGKFSRWWRRPKIKPARNPRRAQLQVERLEDRMMLSAAPPAPPAWFTRGPIALAGTTRDWANLPVSLDSVLPTPASLPSLDSIVFTDRPAIFNVAPPQPLAPLPVNPV